MAKSRSSRRGQTGRNPDRVRPSNGSDNFLPVFLCAVVIVLVGCIAYANSRHGTFVFDDYTHILDDTNTRAITPLMNHLRERRPLVSLSLAINYAISGLDPEKGLPRPTSFHVFNILVHLLAGLTLFGVVRRTAQRVVGPDRPYMSTLFPAAAAALIWVAHPMQTQSVTYIIQRGESMMGLSYLLTLYCTIRGSESSKRLGWYAAAIACCALGMSCKAVMVTAPIVVLLFDRAFLSSSFAEAIRRRWPLYVGLAATWSILVGVGVVGGVLSANAGAKATVGFSYKDVTPLQYLLTQPSVILFYLQQSLFPNGLCLDLGWPVVSSFSQAAAPGVAVLILLGLSVWGCVSRRWWGFVGLWFFLILAPTSSFIPIRDIAFVHRMYLSLAALAVFAAFGLFWLGGRIAPRVGMSRTAVCLIILFPIVGAEIIGTWTRNRVFRQEVSVWADVVDKRPQHARAWVNYGKALNADQRVDDAIRCYETAIALEPNEHVLCAAYTNLGTAYGLTRQYAKARDAFEKAIAIEQQEWPIYANLANALNRLGDKERALAMYAEAIKLDASNAITRVRSARILQELGRHEEAIEMDRAAAKLKPDDPGIWYDLGNCLMKLAREAEAMDAYRRALAINPNDPNARCNLGYALLRLNRPAEAVGEFQQALRVSPQHVPSNFNLGRALEKLGRNEEAAQVYQRVLQIQPGHQNAQAALSRLRATDR